MSEFYLTSPSKIPVDPAQDWLTLAISASPILPFASAFVAVPTVPAIPSNFGFCPLVSFPVYSDSSSCY